MYDQTHANITIIGKNNLVTPIFLALNANKSATNKPTYPVKEKVNNITIILEVIVVNTKYYDEYRALGLNIALYRKDRGYTQIQLAEKIEIDRSHMSAIELAANAPSLDVIFKICDVLQVSPKDLFDFRF